MIVFNFLFTSGLPCVFLSSFSSQILFPRVTKFEMTALLCSQQHGGGGVGGPLLDFSHTCSQKHIQWEVGINPVKLDCGVCSTWLNWFTESNRLSVALSVSERRCSYATQTQAGLLYVGFAFRVSAVIFSCYCYCYCYYYYYYYLSRRKMVCSTNCSTVARGSWQSKTSSFER